GHSGGHDDVTYQLSKGVSFSHGSITAPYAKVELKWNAVEKHVSAMIAQGRFLTDEDRAAMPQYEKHQLARNIRTFFENVPQEQPHPNRKSTRLNSSHVSTSYAVFCLKQNNSTRRTR